MYFLILSLKNQFFPQTFAQTFDVSNFVKEIKLPSKKHKKIV